MNNFNHMEYHASQALRNAAKQDLENGRFTNLDIDENGIASKETRQAIADVLEAMPLDNPAKYDKGRSEQALLNPADKFSIVDFVIMLIYKYKQTNLFAQLYWIETHGKQNPLFESVLLDVPESNEDEAQS